MTDTMTPAEIANWETAQTPWVSRAKDPEGHAEYIEKTQAIRETFGFNLRKEYLNSKVPDITARNLFQVAYSDGHSGGYSEVESIYVQLAELLNGLIEDLGL